MIPQPTMRPNPQIRGGLRFCTTRLARRATTARLSITQSRDGEVDELPFVTLDRPTTERIEDGDPGGL